MSERDDMLEQNLARLFERAYRPVHPTPEFRAKLARSLERDQTADRPVLQRHRFQMLAPRILVAAAILFALGVGYFAYRSTRARSSTPGEIVAHGCVAVRLQNEAGWRSIEPADAARGMEAVFDVPLDVHTPPNVSFRVRDGSEAVVTIGPASQARVDHPAVGAPLVQILAGSVRVDNLSGRNRWEIQSYSNFINLHRGAVSVRIEPSANSKGDCACFVMLHTGEGDVVNARGHWNLHVGVELTLDGDRAVAATMEEPTTTASARTSAAVSSDPAVNATEVAPRRDGFASLTGVIARAETDPVLGRYLVTLLRRERLPAISRPNAYPFDGAERFTIRPVTPGTYDIFVEFEGRAPWSALGVEIEAEKTRELAIVTTPGTSLSGRVVADVTGKPVENALVIVEDQIPAQVIQFDADEKAWSASTRTDSSGAFRLEHVTSGAHVVRATAAGFGATWSSRMEFDASTAIELRLANPGRLAGRVAHDDGQAWRGAIVIASFMRPEGGLDRFSYGMAIADEDGQYSIPDLPAGDYVLLNVLDTSPGLESTPSRQVRVAAGATTIANLPDATDGPRFQGRVLDALGAPLGGLDVTLQPHGVNDDSNWRSQRTDAAGHFSFTGLPSTSYDVFVGESLGERFAWVEEITVPPSGDFEHDIRVGTGSIRGRAVSKAAVIGGAFVLLQRAERDQFLFAGRVRTDAQGVFTFDRLQPATYRVIVYPAQKGLAAQASADLWIAQSGPPVECELAVQRGASLTVIVRDARGTPLPGIALTFVDGAGHAQRFRANDVTGPDGRYAIEGIAVGRWVVSARGRDGASITQNIELNVGDERELVLTLP